MKSLNKNWLNLILIAGVTLSAGLILSIVFRAREIGHMIRLQEEKVSLVIEDTNQTQAEIIDNIISHMSPEEKIGQLIMINYFGEDLKKVNYLINELGIGGIMLLGANVEGKSFKQIQDRNGELLKKSHRIPLFISVDQEGGGVARIRKIIREYPYPSELYRQKGVSGIKEQALYYSENLKRLNVNINFSPVVDVVKDKSSIIAERSFSSDGQVNAELGKLYVEIFDKESMIAVPKHYPGYGTVSRDPHFDICKDETTSVLQLAQPFFQLQSSPMIMSSHVIFTQEDSVPATLSPKVIQVLRDKGYSNIIISDDIQMQSVTKLYDFRLASLKALQADCDIVLSVTKNDKDWFQKAKDLHAYLLKAYRSKLLTESTVNEALSRILRIKLKYLKEEKWTIVPHIHRNSLNLSQTQED